jgi:hypothetical protein
MSISRTVEVLGLAERDSRLGILRALADSCGVNLLRSLGAELNRQNGLIILGGDCAQFQQQVTEGRPAICITLAERATPSTQIRFADGNVVPRPFRGRTLVADSTVAIAPRKIVGEVLATADESPVWTSLVRDGARLDRCWVPHPWIESGDCVFDHLNGSRLMNLLPLLEWLRHISGWHRWQQPPLRACFMFDDPNLHAARYGYVNYAQLAAEGRRHNYHSSFATVPLDSYFCSRTAARIIRENGDTLSFLIHGNNHSYRELADRTTPPDRQLAQMHQAISRTSRLEERAGLAVARVMAPPHGVCSSEMMAAMAGAGFEAVCVSHGSVRTGNPEAEWVVSLGAFPGMIVSDLAVIPRFALSRSMKNQILLAAYLNQAIIPVGHHWDLSEGLDILSSGAKIINGLGEVIWGNMTTLVRSNFRYKIEGSVMQVWLFSRLVWLNIPEHVTAVEVVASVIDPTRDRIEVRVSTASAVFEVAPANTLIPVVAGSVTELRIARIANSAEPQQTLPRTPLKVVGRKVIVELRDRAMPVFPRGFFLR